MSKLIHTRVGDIRDSHILALIDELERVCPVASLQFIHSPLITFLVQCLYPEGSEKRMPIKTEFAPTSPLLESRVGKLPDSPLRDLCLELALLSGHALEFFHSDKIYFLLNKTIPKSLKPRAPSAEQKRWSAIVNRRRSNRGSGL